MNVSIPIAIPRLRRPERFDASRWPKDFRVQEYRAGIMRIAEPYLPAGEGASLADHLAVDRALRLAEREHSRQCGIGFTNVLYSNDATAYSQQTWNGSELGILQGNNDQPALTPLYFSNSSGVPVKGKRIRFEAEGVLSISNNASQTVIFQLRLGASGLTTYSGGSVGVSKTITCTQNVSNQWWRLQADIRCDVPGVGTNNMTLTVHGYVWSPGGFASPFCYALEPTTPDTAAWSNAAFDDSIQNYFNLSVTGTNTAGNTITVKDLIITALN